jgi:acetyl-CoA synthetase
LPGGTSVELKGEEVFAFVTLEGDQSPSKELEQELKPHVANFIGAIARPGEIRFTDSLLKTPRLERRHERASGF